MVQILCDGARCERAAQEIRCSRRLGGSAACVNGLWFLGEKESEDRVSLVPVIREPRHKMTWAMLVPRKGMEFPQVSEVLRTRAQQNHAHVRQRAGHWSTGERD